MLSPPSSAPRRPIFDNAAVVHQLTADRNEMLVPGKQAFVWSTLPILIVDAIVIDFSRVLCIYTGGTIGMKHTKEHGYIPVGVMIDYVTHLVYSKSHF